MKGNNVLGVPFANTGDGLLTELTKMRAMASVPVGGRYRMVDFTLSNMVHAGMSRVGMITKSNYRSLMDHVGNGKSWDLARKNGGLSLLPPFSHSEGGVYTGRIDALFDVIDFIASGEEEYVLLCDCDVVSSIDIERVFDFHTEKKADITIVCKQMAIPAGQDSMTMETDGDARILDVKIGEEMEREALVGLDMIVISKALLIQLLKDASSHNHTNFSREIIQKNADRLHIYAYETAEFAVYVDSMQSYYRLNMSLLDRSVRSRLFIRERPVFTKIRDNMPTRYGLGSRVSNSLIADGCVIEGEVENCVLFRDVKVAKGARLKNCILMQATQVGENAQLNYVITDKNVVLGNSRIMTGFETYPVFVQKGAEI